MSEQIAKAAEEQDDVFVDELKPGTALAHGQYTIEDFLAAGGFGITYLARDSLDRQVVIKECFPGAFCGRSSNAVQPKSRAHMGELQKIVRLFTKEAQSLARVEHPNIVRVHHVFQENNTAYMAMDFVKGRDLLDILRSDDVKLTPEQIRRYLEKMLDAIGFVHDREMLHRDISPDNIIIREDGEPVLIDFGAAREQATEARKALSALRVVKEGYSPQEFYIAGSEQGPPCDLYSLAASFYHIITGKLPPDSQVRLAAFAGGDPDPYRGLKSQCRDFDDAFCAAIDKAMSILPKDRMDSAKQWRAMMDGEIPIQKTVGGQPEPKKVTISKKSSGGLRKVALLGAVAGIALVAGAAFVALQEDSIPDIALVPATESEPTEVAEAPEPVAAPVETPAEETVVVETPLDETVAAVTPDTASDTPAPEPSDPVPEPDIASAPDLITEPRVFGDIENTTSPAANVVLPSFDDAFGADLSTLPTLTAIDLATPFTAPTPPASSDALAPSTYVLRLPNDFVFVAAKEEGRWVTRVTEVPEDGSQLAVGDRLVAHMNTNTMIDGPDSLKSILRAESAAGRASVLFAIESEGQIKVTSIPVPEGAL